MKKCILIFAIALLGNVQSILADTLFEVIGVGELGVEEIGSSTPLLAVEEAFRFGAYVDDDGLHLFWQIQPGYFLYREKVKVVGDRMFTLGLPDGELRDDELFGMVQVLDGLVEVVIDDPAALGDLVVEYQGCAALGYCYPPQKKQLKSGKEVLNSENSSSLLGGF